MSGFVQRQFARFWELEEGRFFLWLPVFLSFGIICYFSMPFEPTLFFVLSVFGSLVLIAVLLQRYLGWLAIPAIIVALAGGFTVAKLRTEIVRSPVIHKAKGFYAIEGRLERLTLLPRGAKQLHLTKLMIEKLSPDKTPFRIRITSRIKGQALTVGSRLKLKAILRPPPGPVRPDGFDFARQAWFSRLGGVGFAISKIEVTKEAGSASIDLGHQRIRQIVSNKIRAVTSGHGKDIAVALIVGEKRSIDKGVLASIRAAGLAHMLAISGMHMALVSGTMFWVLRAFLALFETLALSFDVRKFAAMGAISTAAAYYLLSGMSVSTLRAFIMITIMFVAVLLGRRALSLRNVAIAALIILLFWPESLLMVGFQMSFASVVALVSFYESGLFRGFKTRSELVFVRMTDKIYRGIFGIFMTTLIAGLAVAPIAVYHFHHITTYSVVGNVLAMPILSLVVMPMALVGLVAMPFDLHGLPLYFMGQGNGLIVKVAQYVAGFDDARVNVGTIDLVALLAIMAGGLWLCLWRSRFRYAGLLAIIVGLIMTPYRATPFLLVERDGKNIVLIDENKAMWPMAPRVGRYSLAKWKSAFGTSIPPRSKTGAKKAAEMPEARLSQATLDKTLVSRQKPRKWRCDQHGCVVLFKGLTIAYSSHPGALGEDCVKADILVATYPVPRSFKSCARVQKIIDIKALRRNGAHAIFLDNKQLKITDSRTVRGKRPWTLHN